jgi:hypothetical protein
MAVEAELFVWKPLGTYKWSKPSKLEKLVKLET